MHGRKLVGTRVFVLCSELMVAPRGGKFASMYYILSTGVNGLVVYLIWYVVKGAVVRERNKVVGDAFSA